MKTKAYVRFLNRAVHLDADIELVDLLAGAARAGHLHVPGSKHLFAHITPLRHPRLTARESNDHNRKLAFTHLKATLCTSFLKKMYEDTTRYLCDILESAAKNGLDPNRLIGEHKTSFDANDLLACKSWDSVVKLVSSAVFRKLENERSTKDLLQKINGKLNLGVEQSAIDKALPYFEMRHLLVHADCLADKAFCDKFPSFGATPGKRLPLGYQTLKSARTAVFGLISEVDAKVIQNNVAWPKDLQP